MISVFDCHPITVLLLLLKHLKLVMVRHLILDYLDLEVVFGSLHECPLLKFFLFECLDMHYGLLKKSYTLVFFRSFIQEQFLSFV